MVRRTILPLVIGIGLGVVGTLAVQFWARTADSAVRHQALVISVTPSLVQQALPSVRVLDVSTISPATQSVNYGHDELYDVYITYQRANEVRQMVVPFGFARGTPIAPAISDFVIADDTAKLVRQLTPPGGR